MPQRDSATSDTKVLGLAPFDQWKYEDAYNAFKQIKPDDFDIVRRFVEDHDHLQKGRDHQWVGPGDPQTNAKLEKQFAPDDAISEVLANISNAFAEPQISIVAIGDETEETKAKMAELREALTQWWDKRRLQELLQDRLKASAWAGWAGLRLWIPWRFLEVDNEGAISFIAAADPKDALKYVHVMAPKPNHGAVIIDTNTQDMCAVFIDEEIEYINGKKEVFPRAELVYLDPTRGDDDEAMTHMRIIYANNAKPEVEARFPLGGRMTYAEMRGEVLLTEPVMRTQRQLNLLSSLITRIGETAAFRERYTTNARPQGTRVPYVEGEALSDGAFLDRDEEGRLWEVIPQARTLGAGTTTELVGLPRVDNAGDAKGYETPGITIADPVDPGPYVQAADGTRRRILRMCGQGHLGGVSNAEASGIAYEQARAVFEKDLQRRRVSEEGMLRDLLTAAVALAEMISQSPGYYTDVVRITVDQHINPGPRSPDSVRLDLESYVEGALSGETLMSRMGVEDTEAELRRLQRSPGFIMSLLQKAAEASTAFTPDSIKDVLLELGVPDEVVNKLEGKEEPDPIVPQPDDGDQ